MAVISLESPGVEVFAPTEAQSRESVALRIPLADRLPPKCRHCGHDLTLKLIDLGLSPVANDYVDPVNYMKAEPFYPLEVFVCRECRLAQTRDLLAASEIFRADY